MKLFLDTADLNAINKWAATGILDGVTTNPSHLSKEGGDPKKLIKEIIALLPDGEISVEVTTKNPNDVYAQAKEIAKLGANVLVKIPCHVDYYPVINRLAKEGVPLNITLVFTLLQGIMMSKLDVRYVSPFVGRLDDNGVNGIELLSDMREAFDTYDAITGILAASIRSVHAFHEAVIAGADAVTVPASVLEQAVHHPLTDRGMVAFDADWKKLGLTQFP